ncbi:MAG: carbohydrate ABC transporter permease [Bacillota bacterium]
MVLLAGAFAMAFPLLWLLSTALRPEAELLQLPPRILPSQWTLSNFTGVFNAAPFGRYFLNSMIFATGSTFGILTTSLIAGYIFAKFRFPGNQLLFMAILATAIVPFEIYMIPLYLLMKDLKLINTMPGILLPYLVMSYGIFFMRQNVIASIPDELLEAARIDGLSEWGIMWRIVMPLLAPAMSALAIFAFLQAWTAFIWPLLVINTKDLYTMELGLSMFQTGFTVHFGLTAAGSILSLLPIVITFLFLRRQIIEGVTLTGLKG